MLVSSTAGTAPPDVALGAAVVQAGSGLIAIGAMIGLVSHPLVQNGVAFATWFSTPSPIGRATATR